MRKLRLVGFLFFVFGICLSWNNFQMTGAVIGGSSQGYFALAFLFVGIVVLYVSGTLESKVGYDTISPEEVSNKLDHYFPGATRVVDSSFVVPYSGDIDNLMNHVGSHGEVIVPEEVLDELRGNSRRRTGNLMGPVSSASVRPNDEYLKFLSKAKGILGQGDKPYMADIVLPVLEGRGEIDDPDEYRECISKLSSELGRYGGVEFNTKDAIKYAKTHWAVSDGDAAVLATAMMKAQKGSVVILHRDRDLSQAVRFVNKNYGLNIHYMDSNGNTS